MLDISIDIRMPLVTGDVKDAGANLGASMAESIGNNFAKVGSSNFSSLQSTFVFKLSQSQITFHLVQQDSRPAPWHFRGAVSALIKAG